MCKRLVKYGEQDDDRHVQALARWWEDQRCGCFICPGTNSFYFHKALNFQLKVIFIGVKKVGNKLILLVYLLLSSLIINSNLMQCLHLKENNLLSYFVSKPTIIPSGTKNETGFLVFKGAMTMKKSVSAS